jgi:H+-translocating NAD(P) transhydrogenase subunit alpha
MAEHSSQLFARNVQALLDLLVVPKEGGADGEVELKLDFEDEIVAGACTVRDGEIVGAGAKAAVEAAEGGAGA